jgi:hypothetical protein
MTRRLIAVAVAALLLLTGCEPGPRDNRPPGHPPTGAPPGAAEPTPYDVYFVVEVTGPAPDYRPYTRQVTLTIAAVQKDGQHAINPATGLRAPLQLIRTTPVRHGITLGAGVVFGSVTAVYLGTAGERLSCYVERDGAEVPFTRMERRIDYTASGRGGVEVFCITS